MYQITEELPQYLGYKLRNTKLHTMCYTDDAVLLSETEDSLRNVATPVNKLAESNSSKTKRIITLKEPYNIHIRSRWKYYRTATNLIIQEFTTQITKI